jgi:ketosteroid isomerase-like protein
MSDEEAISIAKTEFREAYNTGDVNRLLSVFADSFTDMSEGEASFYGEEAKTALQWRFTNLFRECNATMEVIIIAIVVVGDKAYDWGWHKLTLVPKSGGATVIKRSRYCEIWQKNEIGKWQIRLFIDNKDHLPELLPQEATAWASSQLIVASAVH